MRGGVVEREEVVQRNVSDPAAVAGDDVLAAVDGHARVDRLRLAASVNEHLHGIAGAAWNHRAAPVAGVAHGPIRPLVHAPRRTIISVDEKRTAIIGTPLRGAAYDRERTAGGT